MAVLPLLLLALPPLLLVALLSLLLVALLPLLLVALLPLLLAARRQEVARSADVLRLAVRAPPRNWLGARQPPPLLDPRTRGAALKVAPGTAISVSP